MHIAKIKKNIIYWLCSLLFLAMIAGLLPSLSINTASTQAENCSGTSINVSIDSDIDASFNGWVRLAAPDDPISELYVGVNDTCVQIDGLVEGGEWQWVQLKEKINLLEGQNDLSLYLDNGKVHLDRLIATVDDTCLPVFATDECRVDPIKLTLVGVEQGQEFTSPSVIYAEVKNISSSARVAYSIDGFVLPAPEVVNSSIFCIAGATDEECDLWDPSTLAAGEHDLSIFVSDTGRSVSLTKSFSVAEEISPVIPSEPSPEPVEEPVSPQEPELEAFPVIPVESSPEPVDTLVLEPEKSVAPAQVVEQEPVKSPVVVVTADNPPSQPIIGTVELAPKTTPSDKVEVTYTVDDELIEQPVSDDNRVELDTTTLEDGQHTLSQKTVSSDGSEIKETITIEVDNTSDSPFTDWLGRNVKTLYALIVVTWLSFTYVVLSARIRSRSTIIPVYAPKSPIKKRVVLGVFALIIIVSTGLVLASTDSGKTVRFSGNASYVVEFEIDQTTTTHPVETASDGTVYVSFITRVISIPDPPTPTPTGLLTGKGYGYVLDNSVYYGLPVGNGVGQSNINLSGSRMVANRFTAKQTGVIKKASFNLKTDASRNGYSSGTFGELEVSIQPVDSSGNPTGEKLASVRRGNFRSFRGGNGGGMTVTFGGGGATVTKDQQYAIVWDNVDANPTTNYFALNFFYGNKPGGSLSHSFYNDTIHEDIFTDSDAYGLVFFNGSSWADSGGLVEDHTAWYEVIYDDNATQGLAYLGGVPTQGYPVSVGKSIGQYFTPPSDFSSDVLYLSPGYRGPNSSTSFTLDITGGGLRVSGFGSMSANNVDDWIEFSIPETTFRAGVRYEATFTLFGGPSVTFRLPLTPDFDPGHEWDGGGDAGWAEAGVIAPGNNYAGVGSDLSMYFLKTGSTSPQAPDPTPDPAPTPSTAIKKVYAIGDSILNEPNFKNGLESGFDARSIELVKVNTEPGRTLSQGLSVIKSDAAVLRTVDTVYIQLCVNGDESNWSSLADQMVAAIRAENSDMRILWSNCYAYPWRYDWLPSGRVEPHNQVLSALSTKGEITLIDWASYAAEHPEVYGGDGVHIAGNESHFVDVIMDVVDSL